MLPGMSAFPKCYLEDIGAEGRIVVEIFTAIYRSNELQRPVKFPLTA